MAKAVGIDLGTTYCCVAYVDDAGRAVIRLDNTSFVPYNEKRNSVCFLVASVTTRV